MCGCIGDFGTGVPVAPVEPMTLRTVATAADGLFETAPPGAFPALAPGPDGGALGRADGRDCDTVDVR